MAFILSSQSKITIINNELGLLLTIAIECIVLYAYIKITFPPFPNKPKQSNIQQTILSPTHFHHLFLCPTNKNLNHMQNQTKSTRSIKFLNKPVPFHRTSWVMISRSTRCQ